MKFESEEPLFILFHASGVVALQTLTLVHFVENPLMTKIFVGIVGYLCNNIARTFSFERRTMPYRYLLQQIIYTKSENDSNLHS